MYHEWKISQRCITFKFEATIKVKFLSIYQLNNQVTIEMKFSFQQIRDGQRKEQQQQPSNQQVMISVSNDLHNLIVLVGSKTVCIEKLQNKITHTDLNLSRAHSTSQLKFCYINCSLWDPQCKKMIERKEETCHSRTMNRLTNTLLNGYKKVQDKMAYRQGCLYRFL